MTLFRLRNLKVYPETTDDLLKAALIHYRNAILDGDRKFVRAVLNKASKENKPRFITDDFLYLAIAKNDFEITKLLLEHGANPNALNGGVVLETIRPKNSAMLELLLLKGADPNINDGMLLTQAVKGGDFDLAQLLLLYDADPNANNGEALSTAAKNGKYKLVNLLCHYGANPNNDDTKALTLAEKHKHHRTMLSLLYYGADSSCFEKSSHFQLARLVLRTKIGSVQEFEPKHFLCIPYKSQEQKDYDYVISLMHAHCHPDARFKLKAVS